MPDFVILREKWLNHKQNIIENKYENRKMILQNIKEYVLF